MSYLDVTPMIASLRTMPEHFEMDRDWLVHIPSRHSFQFDATGRVRIMARCSCSSLSIRPIQQPELCELFHHWHTSYWRPLLINREFASHFLPPSRVRQFLITAVARLHRALLQSTHRKRSHKHEESIVAAE